MHCMENHRHIHAELLQVTSQIWPLMNCGVLRCHVKTAYRLGHDSASKNEFASSSYSRQDISSKLVSLRGTYDASFPLRALSRSGLASQVTLNTRKCRGATGLLIYKVNLVRARKGSPPMLE